MPQINYAKITGHHRGTLGTIRARVEVSARHGLIDKALAKSLITAVEASITYEAKIIGETVTNERGTFYMDLRG